MPKYIANEYLTHKEKVVKPGEDIELTKDQAKRLGSKVSAKTEAGAVENVEVVKEK